MRTFTLARAPKGLEASDLAQEFAVRLVLQIGAARYRRARSLNRALPLSVCSTHEVCDPNQIMLDCFAEVVGRECDLNDDRDMGYIEASWTEWRLDQRYDDIPEYMASGQSPVTFNVPA